VGLSVAGGRDLEAEQGRGWRQPNPLSALPIRRRAFSVPVASTSGVAAVDQVPISLRWPAVPASAVLHATDVSKVHDAALPVGSSDAPGTAPEPANRDARVLASVESVGLLQATEAPERAGVMRESNAAFRAREQSLLRRAAAPLARR
jgi:hypothetical protein